MLVFLSVSSTISHTTNHLILCLIYHLLITQNRVLNDEAEQKLTAILKNNARKIQEVRDDEMRW